MASETPDLRKYRIELPNLIDDMDLSVYAFRLYVHLKRRAGAASDGYCNEGTRAIADACKMSLSSVSSAKTELLEAGLISIERAKHGTSSADRITLTEMWTKNYEHFSGKDAPLPVREANTPFAQHTDRSHSEHPVREANSTVRTANSIEEERTKEEVTKEERTIEEGDIRAYALSAPTVLIEVETTSKAETSRQVKVHTPKADPDAPLRDLFIAFRQVRYPKANAEAIPPAEYKSARGTLKALADGGATPDDIRQATSAARRRFKSVEMVTLPTIARHYTALMEPDEIRAPPNTLPRGPNYPMPQTQSRPTSFDDLVAQNQARIDSLNQKGPRQ